jgi:hypothetical protein
MSALYKSDEELLKYYRSGKNYHIPEAPIPKRNIWFVIDNLLATFPDPEKLYYKLIINFPIDFIQTSKPKFVHVKNAKYYHFDTEVDPPLQVFIGSDIIQGEKYSDSFLCCCNEAHQYKSLQIFDARTEFQTMDEK